jgi:hypothetical protein
MTLRSASVCAISSPRIPEPRTGSTATATTNFEGYVEAAASPARRPGAAAVAERPTWAKQKAPARAAACPQTIATGTRLRWYW